jgi:hypothetical protein
MRRKPGQPIPRARKNEGHFFSVISCLSCHVV